MEDDMKQPEQEQSEAPSQPEAQAESEQLEQEQLALADHEVVCSECGAHYSKGDIACPNVSNHGA